MTPVEVARLYRERHGWDMPTRKLAKIMFDENPLQWKDLEAARASLRYIEGKKGKDRDRKRPMKVVPDRPYNPYSLPESHVKPYVPFHIAESSLLILSDVHLPYQDNRSLTAVFDYVKQNPVQAILLNGDTLDFYGLSRFVRDPNKRSVADELQALKEFYEIIKEQFKVPVYYKFGNHEERYDHFIYTRAAEIAGVEEFNLEEVVKRRMPGVQVIKDKRIIQFGSLNIIHGHEYASGIFQSVNVARGLFLKSKVSSLQGHAHQVSEHTETDMNGKITTTWSVGCLCDMHPDYAKLNKWSQGFAIATRTGDAFQVQNFRIHDGVIL